MFQQNPFTRALSTWWSGDRQVLDLALQAETKVRALSQLPSRGGESDTSETAEILNSVCLLLDRLLDHKRQPPAAPANPVAEAPEPPPSDPVPSAPLPPTPLPAAPEPTLSQTAKELMKLRDWVLLACHEGANGDRAKFESLYQKLGKILSLEGVSVLEETGVFNYVQQQVIDTVPTEDPAQDETIASTVRPGYQFNQKLVRPQEVIVYTYQPTDAVVNELEDLQNADSDSPNPS